MPRGFSVRTAKVNSFEADDAVHDAAVNRCDKNPEYVIAISS